MKKSKRAKTQKRKDDADMISKLPDPILHLILSGLPTTEEVIRTSILSRRWRYLWTSISSIDIDDSRRLKPLNQFDVNRFKEFVYWVLANKSLDLDSFRLHCSNYYGMSTIGRWIHLAVTRNVKLLDLVFCPREKMEKKFYPWMKAEDVELPHCLVTCTSLEVLKLFFFGRRLSLPNFAGFSALRVLELNSIELSGDDALVKDFLESCPLLEDLSLIDCFIDKLHRLCISSPKLKNLRIDNWTTDYNSMLAGDGKGRGSLGISCPKLVVLQLTGYIPANSFFESPDSLKKAVILPKTIHRDIYDGDDPPICDLFAEICHVESLALTLQFVVLCCPYEEPEFPVSLPNLKTLELTTDHHFLHPFCRILTRSPHLESLHLIIEEQFCSVNKCKIYADHTSILTDLLKKVEFIISRETKYALDMASFLLERGNALEDMVFTWYEEANYHNKSIEVMQKVSKFQKASSTVKLSAKCDPSRNVLSWFGY